MIKFLLKVIIVFSVLILIFYITDKLYLGYAKDYRNLKIVDNLVLGDSHTQTAVNDSIINNSLNISIDAENYFFSYYKLIFYTTNYKIKNVILGLSYHNFSSVYDNSYYKSEILKMENYIPLLDLEGHIFLFNQAPMTYLKSIKKALKYQIKSIFISNNRPVWEGKYYSSKNSNLADSTIDLSVRRHYIDKYQKYYPISLEQIEYTFKMIELCSDKNIKIYMLVTPLHTKYMNKVPEQYRNILDSIKTITQNNKLDFSNYSFNDNQFGDGDHLNYFGSILFSRVLSDTLKYFGSYNSNIIKN